jgi:hypothetical protein
MQTLCKPRVPLQLFTNENTSNKTLAETTGIENQNPLKTQTLTLSEKKKQFKENFIEQNQSEVVPKLQIAKTETRMSFRKPLRRITSDREKDDCLFNKKILNLATLLSLHQLACPRVQ